VKLEDEPTPPKLTQLLTANPKLRIYGGLGASMFWLELRRGAIGIMTGFGFPEVLVEIHRAFAAGENRGRQRSSTGIPPSSGSRTRRGSTSSCKHLYARRGALASRGTVPGPRAGRAPCAIWGS
jgi:4-hydroxy-tetrahydrodipicolinate synthase